MIRKSHNIFAVAAVDITIENKNPFLAATTFPPATFAR